MHKFENVLAAISRGDRLQWAIGAALLKDIPDDDEGEVRLSLKECSQMLAEHGFPSYGATALGRMRLVASRFPASRRHEGVSFEVHVAAGTPDNLDRLVKLFAKSDKPLTQDNARHAMAEWHKKEADHRKEQREKADIDVAAARFRKKQATEDELATVNPAKRDAARAARRRAEDDEAEAQERRKKHAAAPKRGDTMVTTAPDTSSLDVLAKVHAICESAHKMRSRLTANLKEIDDMIYLMEGDSKQKIKVAYQEVETVLKHTYARFERKGSLRAIDGGAA